MVINEIDRVLTRVHVEEKHGSESISIGFASDLAFEVERLRINPEDVADEPPSDCRHKRARCADCRWPLWTMSECIEIKQNAHQAYHEHHDEISQDDCLVCKNTRLTEALELMYEAWKQLIPCLKRGSVKDYELVCTTAPVATRAALEKK